MSQPLKRPFHNNLEKCTVVNPNFTPPGADILPLAQRLRAAVEPSELESFLSKLPTRLQGTGSFAEFIARKNAVTYFLALFRVSDSIVVSALVKFLAKNEDLFVLCLRANPSIVAYWSREPALLRRLWRELLFMNGSEDAKIYVALLRNSLIPSDQLAEANEWVVAKWVGEIPDLPDLPTLQEAGFFETFRKYTFGSHKISNFDWANSNARLIRWSVERNPITDEIARSLAAAFSGPYFAHRVGEALKDLFISNPDKRAELENAISAGEYRRPEAIL